MKPSPYELIPPILLSTLMMTISIVEAGVAMRVLASNDLDFAATFFKDPLPLVGTIKMFVGPSILLLIPKIFIEDVLPMKRTGMKKVHLIGVLHFVPILLIFTAVPRAIQAASHDPMHLVDVRQLLSANLTLIFVCILLMVLSILQVREKSGEIAPQVAYSPVDVSSL